jgi:RNA polymerase sigma factor (sigma-70 family)
MEASALKHSAALGMRGPTPLLRLQSDERLIVLIRRGNHGAFEALVARYQSRLLAFCRHMLGSREDAEDVLQEVFAASFNAILADDRAINVRPWLYRIARNRSLNHLRRVQAIGVDSMDVHLSEGGATTADKVHKREEFRLLVADVQELPETQKTALLLREIDALSYEQIAEVMDTTIPSVKSLLVRARVSLAEAAEARLLTCEDVREELGEIAEGLRRSTAPARRHVRTCERCQGFKAQLRSTNKALAAVYPVAPLLLLKKFLLAQFGMTASAGAGSAAGAAAASVAATGGTSVMSAGISTIATKTAAGLAAAAIVTAGAVEVKHVQTKAPARAIAAVTARPAAPVAAPSEPEVVASAQQPVEAPKAQHAAAVAAVAEKPEPAEEPAAQAPATEPAAEAPAVVEPPAATDPGATVQPPATTDPPLAPVQEESDSTTLTGAPGPPEQTGGVAAPAEPVTPPLPVTPDPAPPAATAPEPPAPAAAPAPASAADTSTAASGTGGATASKPSRRQRVRRDRAGAATGKDMLRERVARTVKLR